MSVASFRQATQSRGARGPYRKRCASCGAPHVPHAGVPVCEACVSAPPPWMIASEAFLAEQFDGGTL